MAQSYISQEPTPLKQLLSSTTVKEVHPHVFVYCYPSRITFGNETVDCPPYVFRLMAGRRWNTSDYRHQPNQQVDFSLAQFKNLPEVHRIHLRDEALEFEEARLVNKILELNEQLKKLDHTGVEISVPITTLGYPTGGISSVIILLIVAWIL